VNPQVIGVTLGITVFVVAMGTTVAVMIYTEWKGRRK
jgi:hypothetical protein